MRKLFKLKPNKQSILFLGAVLALLVVASVALFVKQQAALAVASANVEAKRKQVEEGSAIASRLASTEALLRADRDELKFLESSLPSVAYVPTLLKQVEALARDTRNDVRSVRPRMEVVAAPSKRDRRSDPEAEAKAEEAKKNEAEKKGEKQAPEPYDRLHIQLSLTGQYGDCLQFIRRLTRFPKIVAVDDIQMHPKFDDKLGGDPPIDMEMNLTAFILKGTGTVPPALEKEGQAT